MIPRYFTHYKFVSEAVKREGLSANEQDSNSYCSDGAGRRRIARRSSVSRL